jgi:hypothetical protein
MAAKHARYFVGIAIWLIAVSAFGKDEAGPGPWTTRVLITLNTELRLHWKYVNEGFDTVTRVEAIRDNKRVKAFDISGQPVFNQRRTFVAFPNCWHGGCEKQIKILDLTGLTELRAVGLERESFGFLTVAWETERRLKVEFIRTDQNGQAEGSVRYFDIAGAQPSNPPLQRTR